MSADAVEAADISKKKTKHKKNNKDSTNSNTKKRKATADVTDESQADDRPSKKSKKDEKKARFAVQPVEPKKDLLEQHSPFVKQTVSLYLPLSPCAHDFALEGLCAEHISPLLLTFFPPLKGVLLSYDNPHMSEHAGDGAKVNGSADSKAILSRSIDEYGVTYVWLTADFTVFQPRRGTYLDGYVNIQNESMLGLVCYNYFNAMVERTKLPEDWTWLEDDEGAAQGQTKGKRAIQGAGHFENGAGEEVGGKIVFKVEDFEASLGSDGGPGTVGILGTLRFDRGET